MSNGIKIVYLGCEKQPKQDQKWPKSGQFRTFWSSQNLHTRFERNLLKDRSNKSYTTVLLNLSNFSRIVLYCILKDRSKTSPIRKCSSNLSYFRPNIWYCILKDTSKKSPIRLCSKNLSYFSPIVWYCILEDRSNISPIPLCSLNLSYFGPTVWYCILKDWSIIKLIRLC